MQHSQSDKDQTYFSAGDTAEAKEVSLPEQYEVIDKLGTGNMGTIYKARNRYTDALFAIKVLRHDYASDNQVAERFVAEAKAASQLHHSNICSVHDFGVSKTGAPYLVMDCIEGATLKTTVIRQGALPAAEAVPIFIQIGNAVAHAHKNRIVHRDLKPENVMLKRDGADTQAIVVDFGIAKVLNEDNIASKGLTKTGEFIGTPLYMAPEQARGQAVTPGCDIYSFGCTMFFALTGRVPFDGDSALDVMYKHIYDTAKFDKNTTVPAALQNVVLKAMEKEPADRYSSMAELLADLEQIGQGKLLPQRKLRRHTDSIHSLARTIAMFAAGFVVTYMAMLLLQHFWH